MDSESIRIGDVPQLAPVPKKRPRWLWLAVAAVVAPIALGGGYLGADYLFGNPQPAASPTPSTIRIHGSITLLRGQFVWDTNPDRCEGYRGYDDLRLGTQVVVTDPAGTTIAVGHLDHGVPSRDASDPSRAAVCNIAFSVYAPAGHEFYGIEISHRGKLQYKAFQLQYALALGFD